MPLSNLYATTEWGEFRLRVIKLDGYRCTHCKRTHEEAVLQVHHKQYIVGQKPWDYPMEDVMTLCKGCHASIHGIIPPKSGWTYLGEEDLGESSGQCEAYRCNKDIRYVHYVHHPNWGTLGVGSVCCDRLTESDLGTKAKMLLGRKDSFLDRKKWKQVFLSDHNELLGYKIEIRDYSGMWFQVTVSGITSKEKYESWQSAAETVFQSAIDGRLDAAFKKRGYMLKNGKMVKPQ